MNELQRKELLLALDQRHDEILTELAVLNARVEEVLESDHRPGREGSEG